MVYFVPCYAAWKSFALSSPPLTPFPPQAMQASVNGGAAKVVDQSCVDVKKTFQLFLDE